jgi:hypothetical protein
MPTPDLSTDDLYLAEYNILSTLNDLTFAANRERIYLQFLGSVSIEADNNDLAMRTGKIASLTAAAEVLRGLVNIVTDDVFDSSVSTFKEALNSFLEIYSDQDDHSITVDRGAAGTETLPDNQAYLQICNELKVVHETITDSVNKELLQSTAWQELRATRENVA